MRRNSDVGTQCAREQTRLSVLVCVINHLLGLSLVLSLAHLLGSVTPPAIPFHFIPSTMNKFDRTQQNTTK